MRTLFMRLTIAYLLAMVVLLVLLGVLLSSMVKQDAIEKSQADMLTAVHHLAGVTEKYFAGTVSDTQLAVEITANARIYQTVIWVAPRGSNRFLLADPYSFNPEQMQEEFNNEENQNLVQQVLSGAEVIQTTSIPMFFEQSVLTVGTAYYGSDRQIAGAVLMHRPMEDLRSAYDNIYQGILISALTAGVLGILLFVGISRRISNPLVYISRAARHIARGHFDEHIDVRGASEIQELAASFNSMSESLQNLETLRRDFVANVSHELRSPLTSMQGFLQGLLDGTIPPEKHDMYMDIVFRETQRMNRLIDDLLNLSRMDTGNFSMDVAPFDLNELVRRVIIKYETRITEKKIDMQVSLRKDTLRAKGDMARIEQVISNLLDNAIKFSDESGIIEIWTQDAIDKAFFTIRDHGEGIRADDLPMIWERFYKAERAHTPGKGTGLGLAIVKNIIEQHGEKITVQSQVGQGSTFTFSLPTSEKEE